MFWSQVMKKKFFLRIEIFFNIWNFEMLKITNTTDSFFKNFFDNKKNTWKLA